MKLLKEQEIILEDPFVIRPGTSVRVTAELSKSNDYSWDSSSDFNQIISGFVSLESIKSETSIPVDKITLEYGDNNTTVTIESIDSGTVDLTIYYLTNQTNTLSSKSALKDGETNLDNHEYIISRDDKVIPMTLIDLSGTFDMDEIQKIEISTSIEDRGLCQIGDQYLRINSVGTLTSDVNVLRKGTEEVWVSSEYTGSFLLEENNQKRIQIDNQEPQVSGLEFFGMENVGQVVFIMTSNGLYGFDKWADYVDPMEVNGNTFSWPSITGTDLTYTDDDALAIADGTEIKKYFLRHDFVLLDKENNRIYFREPKPDFEVA